MLTKIEGNKFISDSSERYLYESKGVDLEQLDFDSIATTLRMIHLDLSNLKIGEVSKYYRYSNKIIFDFDEEKSLQSSSLSPLKEGLNSFIGFNNIYSDAEFEKDFVKFNSLYFRFFQITPKEGQQIDIDYFRSFGDYFLMIKKIDTKVSKGMVDDARKMNHSKLYSLLSDIEGIENYARNEDMLRKIILREEELFKMELTFFEIALSEEELFQKTELLIKRFESSDFNIRISTYSLRTIWNNYIPSLPDKFTNESIAHTSLIANCIPIDRDIVHKEGISFRSRSGEEVFLNLMSGDSYSMVVTGQTGKGKTVFVKKILDYEINQGHGCLIIDPKEDYRAFALLNNFRIIEGDINPMIFKDDIYFRDIILSKIPICEYDEKFKGRLLNTIRRTDCFKEDDFFKAISILEKNGFSELEFYFEALKGKISKSVEEITPRVYFLSSSFTSETFPLILTYAFEYLKRLNMPFKFVIDEAHRVLNHDPVYLSERVRELRVLKSGLIPITQNYTDLTSTDHGAVVADNCFHKVFFKQNINKTYDLDPFDIERISTLIKVDNSYSEFFYKTDTLRKVIQYHPTLKELEVYRSGNTETRPILDFISDHLKYYSTDECINLFVRNKYGL